MTRRTIAAVAFITSLAAYLIIMVTGVGLAAVEQSGERGLGVLLVAGGTLAFAAAMVLVFAGSARLRKASGRAGLAIATLCAIVPVATLAGAAFAFAGLPMDSPMPALDWGVFAIGAGFSAGALCLAILGWSRIRAGAPLATERRVPGVDEPQSGLI
jgi:amino acid transporter